LQRSIDRLLSTAQLGITCSSLALGWIGEKTMAVAVATWVSQLPLPKSLTQTIAHSLSVPIAFILIAYLQIVLGELCPKSVALIYAEQLARFLGPPSLAIARFFKPLIWILNQSTRWILKLLGIQYTGHSWYDQVTAEELQMIIQTSTESMGLEAEARELLNNVFEFGDVTAAAVMVPRTSMSAIANDATFQMLLDEVAESRHSRYPVVGESLDEIRGVISFKELALPLAQGVLSSHTPIEPWIRPAQFVPEYMPLSELLSLMQQTRQQMVLVVDEFGGTAGLVTLKDVVAEIIGTVHSLENPEELEVQSLDEQTWLVQAQMDVETVNERLNLDIPLMDEYQTLGGFLLFQFQRIPTLGETLTYKNIEFTIISAEGPRLHHLQIHQLRSLDEPVEEQ
jgi:CBS domain containing-hemolysin-like protein